MTKLLLLDIDGTIRKPKSDAKFINDPEDQERWIYFCPENKLPGTLCVRVKRRLQSLRSVELISLWEGNERYKAAPDGYRKPNGGMLRTAISDTVESELTHQHEQILMVGDRPEDEGAAEAAKVDFMWADDWIASASYPEIP